MKLYTLAILNIMTIGTISAQNSIQLYDNGISWVMNKFKNEATNSKGEIEIKKLPNSIVYNSIQVVSDIGIKSTQWLPKTNPKLENLVGKIINVYTVNGESFDGTVEYVSGSSIYLRKDDKVMFISDITKYRLEYDTYSSETDDNTLLIEFEKMSKNLDYDLLYQISGLKWEAESVIIFNSKENVAKVSVLANIYNVSGSNYEEIGRAHV